MSTRLILNEFSVQREQISLFSPVSFTLRKGQSCGLVGPNGIGKTSFLETLVGLHPSYQGNFEITSSAFYLPLKAPFEEEETLKNNMQFWGALWEIQKKTLETAFQTWHLGSLLALPYQHLSQGQKQRANLARLSLKKAPLWLLDEPLANLDQKSIALFHSFLTKHLKGGGSALIATHTDLYLDHKIPLSLPKNFASTAQREVA